MMREAHRSMRVAHCSTMRQHRRQRTGGLGGVQKILRFRCPKRQENEFLGHTEKELTDN